MESYNKVHLRRIKRIFEEKTGVVLKKTPTMPRPIRRSAMLAAVLAGAVAFL